MNNRPVDENGEKVVTRSKPLELTEAIGWVERNAKQALKAYRSGSRPMLRGIKRYDQAVIVDPKKFTRRSRFSGNNIYTVWMSNHPDWHAYPRRDKSLIGTTSIRKAREYYNPYIVFPRDGAKIGVCSEEDVWFSFPAPTRGRVYISHFLDAVLFTIEEVTGEIIETNPDYRKLIDRLTSLDQRLKDEYTDEEFREKLAALGLEHYFDNELSRWRGAFYDTFVHMMKPEPNRFRVQDVSMLPKEVEVWTDTESVLIEYGEALELIGRNDE